MAAKKPDFLQLLQQRGYRRDYTPPPEQKILDIRGSVCGTLQNFIAFSGLPKAGKSTFLTSCIASAFSMLPVLNMQITTPHGRPVVALFDTESSEYDFYRNVDRIKKILQQPHIPPTLHPYRMRDCDSKEIFLYIEAYLENTPECSVLIIDGLLDLIVNSNDETESRIVINWMKKITAKYNLLMIGVIHLGKSTGTTLGAFGAMVDRYAQAVFTVEKDAKTKVVSLKAKYMRSDVDFEPINVINNMGTIEEVL